MCEDCVVLRYDALCKCRITNDVCLFARRCSIKKTWIPLENMGKCPIRLNKEKGNVRFEKKGYLYVDTDEGIIKLKNPYNYVPNNVDIVKSDGQWMINEE